MCTSSSFFNPPTITNIIPITIRIIAMNDKGKRTEIMRVKILKQIPLKKNQTPMITNRYPLSFFFLILKI